jgi:acid phosphatase type 7
MKKLIFTLILMLLCRLQSYSEISMSPYLQAVTTNSIYVVVECSTADTVTVNYGLTTGFGLVAKTALISVTGGGTYVHKIKLINLTANTIYYYQASQGASSSATSNFSSAVLPGTPFRFLAFGDCRSNTTPHGQVSANMLAANGLFSIYHGDYCYDDNYATWKSQFFIPDELSLDAKVPFMSVPGNHENWGANNKAWVYNPESNSGTQDYYSFDYGDVHFLMLNNSVAYTVGSAQYNFAMNDLTNTTRRWKIVIYHEPAYTYGGHNMNTTMQTWYTNVFIPKGVDLIINGHNHFYQHCLVNGLHNFVIGGGGAPLYTPTTGTYVVKSSQSYCYGVFDETQNSLKLSVFSNMNSVIDTISFFKSLSGIMTGNDVNANSYKLYQNYPNPFNPLTKIKFDIPNGKSSNVSLIVSDISGKIIATLVNEQLNSGTYEVTFDGSKLSSGTYFYKLQANDFTDVKKLMLIK